MFGVFFYFYLTPLIRAHREKKAEKRRHSLFRTLHLNTSKNNSSDSYIGRVNEKDGEFQPDLPTRVIIRDSVALKKTRDALSRVEVNPFLSKIAESEKSCYSQSSRSDFTSTPLPPGDSVSPRPYQDSGSSSSLAAASPAADIFQPSFVLSDSQDSVNANMNVKVGDFGLAALIENPGERKKTICGTPNYIAPEVLFDTANGHSFEVDTWSIGVILYTLVVGRPPFQTKEVKAIYK